ncbi:hypothetical protein M0Q50_04480 [bacterium]|jgi:predicted RNase H-like nuclease (RuvC/YqgF family)|nr:hypothetical protein [bacterium]
MKKYYDNKATFMKALVQASNWNDILTEEEKMKSYEEVKNDCIERIFDDYEYVITDLEDEVYDLGEQVSDLEKNVEELEFENIDLENDLDDSIFKNKTLIDLEKIEFLKENWDKITYENLKKII